MSRTMKIRKLKLFCCQKNARYRAKELWRYIFLGNLSLDAGKISVGLLVLNIGNWWRHVKTKNWIRVKSERISLTILSELTFIPEGISDFKTLQHVSRFTDCDLWSPLLDFYRRIWTNTSFLDTSQQSSSFFNLVTVTLNGICKIFHRKGFLSCENLPLQVFVRYSQKQFAKLCWPVTLAGLWTPITCAGHTTR